MTAFDSVSALLHDAEDSGLPLWEYIMSASARESGISRESSLEKIPGLHPHHCQSNSAM